MLSTSLSLLGFMGGSINALLPIVTNVYMFNALYLCPERYLTGWRKHLDLYAIWFGYPAFKREHTKLSKELVIALEEIGITQFNEKTFFLYSLNDLNEEIERANQAKRKIEWRNKLNLSEQS